MIDPELKRAIDHNFNEIEKSLHVKDPLKRLVQKTIDRRTDVKVILKDSGLNIEQIKEMMNKPLEISVSEPTVTHLKVKKNVPTVIEYQGRRYVLDNGKR